MERVPSKNGHATLYRSHCCLILRLPLPNIRPSRAPLDLWVLSTQKAGLSPSSYDLPSLIQVMCISNSSKAASLETQRLRHPPPPPTLHERFIRIIVA